MCGKAFERTLAYSVVVIIVTLYSCETFTTDQCTEMQSLHKI